jgi:tetratricopeptide (TPR) repeat protein
VGADDPDAERWRRLSGLLDRAFELDSPEARAEFVAEIRRGDPGLGDEVAALLAAAAVASPALDGGIAARYESLIETGGAGTVFGPGMVVGSWRLVSPLGRGGMGEVFVAERMGGDFAQRAAIKFLHPRGFHPSLRERFRQERRILARLEHPGIARLIDGGMAPDGTPFLALELVEGRTIVEWCTEAGASVAARVAILLQVCDAVQFAHARLVVHRDLKPSNVLVDAEGRAKLLDFGIAKILAPVEDTGSGPREATALRALTPQYAAPELITGGAVTAATDVYSLGVVAYELLAGVRPYGGGGLGAHELERQVVEEMPPRPSAVAVDDGSRPEGSHLRGRLKGDLDRILLRALAKEPERRYQSVEGFAEDLRRHLAGLPVRARGEALPYRAAKFVRRHRVAVAAGGGLLLALLAGLVSTFWQADRARAAARLAQEEAERSAASLKFLADLFSVSDPAQSKGRVYTDADLLRIAVERIDRDLAAQPELQAPLFRQLAAIFLARGENERGVEAARRALAVDVGRSGPGSLDAARDRRLLGNLRELAGGRPEAARALLRSALASFESAGLGSSQDAIDALTGLEQVESDLGHRHEMARLGARAVELTERLHGSDSVEYAYASSVLGDMMVGSGFNREARSYLETAAQIERRRLGLENPQTLVTLTNLAVLEGNVGDDVRCREILSEILPVARRILGPERQEYLIELRLWARLEERAGRFAAARSAIESVLESMREQGRSVSANYAFALNQLATPVLIWAGDRAGAEARLREAAEVFRRAQGSDNAWILSNLAGVLIDRGERPEARRLLSAADAIDAANGGRESLFHADTLHGFGRLALAAGDRATARREFEQELAMLRREAPDGSRITARALVAVLSTLEGVEHDRRCRELAGEAAAIDARILAPGHPERRAIEHVLAACPAISSPPTDPPAASR